MITSASAGLVNLNFLSVSEPSDVSAFRFRLPFAVVRPVADEGMAVSVIRFAFGSTIMQSSSSSAVGPTCQHGHVSHVTAIISTLYQGVAVDHMYSIKVHDKQQAAQETESVMKAAEPGFLAAVHDPHILSNKKRQQVAHLYKTAISLSSAITCRRLLDAYLQRHLVVLQALVVPQAPHPTA